MEAEFQFESGTRCEVCGLYHADQWQCDPSIPNPWGPTSEDGDSQTNQYDDKKVGW